jgi:hypothetical protein
MSAFQLLPDQVPAFAQAVFSMSAFQIVSFCLSRFQLVSISAFQLFSTVLLPQ